MSVVPVLAALLVMQAKDHLVPALPRLPLPRASASVPAATINDNRTPAGQLSGSTLTLDLDVVESRWRPEGATDPEVPILAFAEHGKAPTVPSPLIRVPAGTTVRLTLHSQVDSALTIGGLRPHSAGRDTLRLGARATRTLEFRLDSIGSYFYWGAFNPPDWTSRDWLDSQLTGALIVDPPGGSRADRIFLVTEWFVSYPDRPFESALVFNGKAWPHSERLTLTQGDSVHWRVLNAAAVEHPMHLHGFYYRITRRGTWEADTAVARDRQALVNTEVMQIGGTMSLSFVPTTVGNWVFHCHFAAHVGSESSLTGSPGHEDHGATSGAGAMASGAGMHQMHGLVLGLLVTPPPGYAEPPLSNAREMRLLLQAQPRKLRGSETAVGFVLQNGSAVPARDSVALPGPVLELERGKPVRITIVNNLSEPSGVHWHGLEIESFPDGVPGWSGRPGRISPPIQPGDSLTVEFIPPRAGTFLYHSHLNDLAQINAGMYGAIVVQDAPRDRQRDHVIIAGGGGPSVFHKTQAPFGFVNGRANPRPIRMTAGETQRLRLVSIHPEWIVAYTLRGDSATTHWRAVAKDGADLPPALVTDRLAHIEMGPGETSDFEFTPPSPGRWVLDVTSVPVGWRTRVEFIVEPKGGMPK